jgi:hypothetical protein
MTAAAEVSLDELGMRDLGYSVDALSTRFSRMAKVG